MTDMIPIRERLTFASSGTTTSRSELIVRKYTKSSFAICSSARVNSCITRIEVEKGRAVNATERRCLSSRGFDCSGKCVTHYRTPLRRNFRFGVRTDKTCGTCTCMTTSVVRRPGCQCLGRTSCEYGILTVRSSSRGSTFGSTNASPVPIWDK